MNTVKIVVRKADKKYIDDNYDRLVASLYEERRLAIKQLKNKEAVYMSITAGRLIQDVVARELGIIAEELTLAKGKNGKPFIPDHEDFCFNISHSGEYVAMAYSNIPVGVDVEQIRSDNMAVARRCFGATELSYIENEQSALSNNLDLDSREARFFHVWTMKESYLKNIGCGISVPLNSFTANPYSMMVEATDYCFATRRLDDYLITLCTQGKTNIVYNIEEKWISCLDID